MFRNNISCKVYDCEILNDGKEPNCQENLKGKKEKNRRNQIK